MVLMILLSYLGLPYPSIFLYDLEYDFLQTPPPLAINPFAPEVLPSIV